MRVSSGITLTLILILVCSIISSLYYMMGTGEIKTDIIPPLSPVKDLSDPFFTTTQKRLRKCNTYVPLRDNSAVKLVFVEPSWQDSHFNETRSKSLRMNLIQSIERQGYQDYVILRDAKNRRNDAEHRLLMLLEHLKSQSSRYSQSLLFVCSTVEVLFGISPKMLLKEVARNGHQIVLPSGFPLDSPDVFFALGVNEVIITFLEAALFSKGGSTPYLRAGAELGSSSLSMSERFKSAVVSLKNNLPITIDSEHKLLGFVSTGGNDFQIGVRGSQRVIHPTGHSSYSPGILVFDGISRSPAYPSVVNAYNTIGYTSAHYSPADDPFSTASRDRKSFRVVVSLTTLPHRIGKIEPTLRSLVDQHIPADAIYLNIPRNYARFDGVSVTDIPQAIRNLPVIINSVDRDWGPATKLIPTLERERDPSTIIVTVDDDMIFKPTLLGQMLERHFNNPRIAYGYAGQLVDVDGLFGPAVVRTAWKWKDADYPVDILEAFRGAMYRRDFFDDLNELKAISSVCFYTDDIWISAYLSRRGIPRVKLLQGWGDNADFAENDKIQPLRSENVDGTRRNDVCALSLLSDFKIGWTNSPTQVCSFEFELL